MTVLLPQPRRCELHEDRVLPGAVSVRTNPALPPQGYRLTVAPDGAVIVDASDAAGAFYAEVTLRQLRRLADDGTVPTGSIEDWPDVSVRGVMLDVSRDKVPTIATLEALIDRLADLKINHVQLYMEHTFAYDDHGEVWAGASPFTAAEVRHLDAFCRARHIELTPNQNSLGHMERWLRHDRYRPLAISPDGWTDARGRQRPPTTVDPSNPGSLELVRSLYAELLPNFSSRRVNVGLDEPWELPDERFADYVDYIAAVRALPELDGYEVLMWGDIVAHHPDQLQLLPAGVTVCEWGYEADHPMDERAAWLAASGRPFWLCPGTSSWNSLVGRTANMIGDCRSTAEAAVRHGAAGYLITDWGDNGHLQHLPVSEPGFAYGAAVSWCVATNAEIDLAEALSAHVFADPTGRLARALLDLGDVHRLVGPQVPNNSILVLPLYSPKLRIGEGVTEGMTDTDLARAADAVAAARDLLASSASRRDDAGLIVAELDTSARLLDLLVRDARARLAAGGRLDAVPTATRAAFADDLDGLIAEHRERWLARNRPGGLDDSVRRLENLRSAYLA